MKLANEYMDPPTADVQIPPQPELVARSLFALQRSMQDDPNELLKFRYLCRGGGLLLCGPTGIGKSSFSIQCAILWALGKPCLGIEPARPLKSLIIQAENDDGDMAEIRDGVIAGIKLTPDEIEYARERVLIIKENAHTAGMFFSQVVGPLLAKYKPDLVWIDPALAYLGGETISQKDVGAFLRNGLNPLLTEYNCGAVVVHHTNKPASGKEKPDWKASDLAYLGSGSAEWANWPRAVLAIRSIGHPDIFELHAGKRGGHLRWRGEDGVNKVYNKHIGYSKEPGEYYWIPVQVEEGTQGGRPKSYDPAELLALLPEEGLTAGEWQKLTRTECGVSESTFHRERKAFLKADKIIKSKVTGKWQPVKKV